MLNLLSPCKMSSLGDYFIVTLSLRSPDIQFPFLDNTTKQESTGYVISYCIALVG